MSQEGRKKYELYLYENRLIDRTHATLLPKKSLGIQQNHYFFIQDACCKK